MIPRQIVAEAAHPLGGQLALIQRGERFVLEWDRAPIAETAPGPVDLWLAETGSETIARKRQPRMLVVGLGLGGLLRAALDQFTARARFDVWDSSRDLIEWRRSHLAGVDSASADPRVSIIATTADQALARCEAIYDFALIDLDHGSMPVEFPAKLPPLQQALAAWRGVLRNGGRLGFAADRRPPRFLEALKRLGFGVTESWPQSRDQSRRHGRWAAIARLPYEKNQ